MRSTNKRQCFNLARSRVIVIATCVAIGMSVSTITLGSGQPASEWGLPQAISEEGLNASLPTAAVDDTGTVHVIWTGSSPAEEQTRGEESSLYYARYDGNDWSEPRDVIVGPGSRVEYPSLTVDHRGALHLTWLSDGRLYYSSAVVAAADSARDWRVPTPLELDHAVPQFPVQIQADAHDILHAVACSNAQTIYYLRSADSGASWLRHVVVDGGLNYQVTEPQLIIDANETFQIVWSTYALGGWPPNGVEYSRSIDGGESWSKPLRLSQEGQFAKASIIEREPSELHVVWSGTDALRGRYHTWSQDAGETWSPIASIDGFPYTLGGTLQGLAVDAARGLHLVAGIEQVRASDWLGHDWTYPVEISPPVLPAERQECEALSAHTVLGNRLLAIYNCPRTSSPHGSSGFVWVNWRTLDAPAIAPESMRSPTLSALRFNPGVLTTNTLPTQDDAIMESTNSKGAVPEVGSSNWPSKGDTNSLTAVGLGAVAAAAVVGWALMWRARSDWRTPRR